MAAINTQRRLAVLPSPSLGATTDCCTHVSLATLARLASILPAGQPSPSLRPFVVSTAVTRLDVSSAYQDSRGRPCQPRDSSAVEQISSQLRHRQPHREISSCVLDFTPLSPRTVNLCAANSSITLDSHHAGPRCECVACLVTSSCWVDALKVWPVLQRYGADCYQWLLLACRCMTVV